MRETAVGVVFVALSVVLTWPLARLLPIAVSYPGDPLLNAWILSWNVHALTTAGTHLYDANIFFPARYALAFSENLFGLLPLAVPLSLAFEPLTVHNVLLIVGFAFSGYGAYVLGRQLTGSTGAGFAAGIIYAFCPWRFTHITHLQHVWGGWLPLIVAAIFRFDRKRDVKSAALVAAALVMNGLTNLHYLVFGGVAASLVWAVLLVSSPDPVRRRDVITAGAALAMSAVVLAAILWPYRTAQMRYAFRGNAAETNLYTSRLVDWTVPQLADEPERHVFAGYVALIAGAVALLDALRSGKERRIAGAATLLIVAGVVLSLGRATPIYAAAFDHLTAIRGIRAPARWAVLAYLGLAMLAARAVATRPVVAAVACIAAVAQVWSVPMRWYLMPRDPAPVYRWLAATPQPGGVLELPIGEGDAYYLYGAAVHHQPIFNGASGAAPDTYRELSRAFSASLIPDSALHALRRLGGSTIVVHSDALRDNREAVRRWLREALRRRELGYVGHFDAGLSGDFVFQIGSMGLAPDGHLRSFLEDDGIVNGGSLPFGFIETPTSDVKARGRLEVRGWALSDAGIRRVRLWFGNKACHVDADLEPYARLQQVVPHYSTEAARFTASIAERPCGPEENDLLVELLDHAGRRATLTPIWFTWRMSSSVGEPQHEK